jgi:hypothetical protein
MTGRPPLPTRHNSTQLQPHLHYQRSCCWPASFWSAGTVRRRRCRPYRVLERSTHFFLLEIGDRTDKVSTLRLKAAQTPADTEPAKPPCGGRPVAQAPPVRALPPKQRGRPRQVTFSLPPTRPPTTSSSSPSIRPPASHRPAAEPTQPLSLPPQSLGGPVVAYRLFLLRFPPRPSRGLLYLIHVVYVYILALACLY